MSGRSLLVMLPGAQFGPQDFVKFGFVASLDRSGTAMDAVVADIPHDAYLDGDVAPLLHARFVAPALARGVSRIWLLGISLGGMGALLTARAALAPIEGLILLSPFLATRGTIADVTRAGGLARWTPPPARSTDLEIGLLSWLQSRPFAKPGTPVVHLGCGREDQYAAASHILAEQLPYSHVAIVPGGHDWPTWEKLWHGILETRPFDE